MKSLLVISIFIRLVAMEESKVRDTGFEQVFSRVNANASENHFIEIQREGKLNYNLQFEVKDYVKICKKITKQSNLMINWEMTKVEGKETSPMSKNEVNLCDDKLEGNDAAIQKYIMCIIGIEETKCPIEMTEEAKKLDHNRYIEFNFTIPEGVKEIKLAMKLLEPGAKEPLINEMFKSWYIEGVTEDKGGKE